MEQSDMNIMVLVAAYPGGNPGHLIEQGFLSNVRQLRVSRS